MRWIVVGAAIGVALGGCTRAHERVDGDRPSSAAAGPGSAASTGTAGTATGSAAGAPALSPLPTGPGLAPGTYRLTRVEVAALPTTATGHAWDIRGGAPDLSVEVRIDGAVVDHCRVADDQLAGACQLDALIDLGPSTVLTVTVIDRDLAADDAVGTATLADPSRWGLDLALPMAPTDRLDAARIFLAAGPTWWAEHQDELVRLAMFGIALAGVLAWFIHGRRQERAEAARAIARDEAAATRRHAAAVAEATAVLAASLKPCAHCATAIAQTDAVCPNCGARPRVD
jgi:hypothetical protein